MCVNKDTRILGASILVSIDEVGTLGSSNHATLK